MAVAVDIVVVVVENIDGDVDVLGVDEVVVLLADDVVTAVVDLATTRLKRCSTCQTNGNGEERELECNRRHLVDDDVGG